MADEAALLEAPEVDAAAIDTTTDVDTSGAEPGITDGVTDTDQTGADLKGPKLWRDTKTKLEESGKFSKAEINALRRAIHYEDGQSKKYPDGLAPLEAAQQAIQRLVDDPTAPIEQVIEQTLQERNYFRELDDLFTSGKPDFVEKLAEAQSEAFQQMAPAVFRKFSELNPEGYSAYVSRFTLQRSGSPSAILDSQGVSSPIARWTGKRASHSSGREDLRLRGRSEAACIEANHQSLHSTDARGREDAGHAG
jgi:hypothetical protein